MMLTYIIHIKNIVIFGDNAFLNTAGIGIAFLALSYVVGHVISYLSARFVEGLVTHHFGYPSFHLMASDETDRDTYIENRRKKHNFCKSPLIYIVLLPVVIFQKIFSSNHSRGTQAAYRADTRQNSHAIRAFGNRRQGIMCQEKRSVVQGDRGHN